MDELRAFLTARLDEDEQTARDAHAYDIEAETEDYGPTTYQVASWAKAEPPVRGFVDRFTPARVLADLAAKRRILNDLVPDIHGMDGMIEGEWGHHSPAAERLLELLALPYAGHPDYREEWRP